MNVLPQFGRGYPSLAYLPWNPMFVRPRRSAAVGALTAGTGGAGRAGAGSLRGCRRLASGTLFSQLKSDIRLHEFCIGESVETKHHAAGSSMATCTPKLRLFVDFAKKNRIAATEVQQRINAAREIRFRIGVLASEKEQNRTSSLTSTLFRDTVGCFVFPRGGHLFFSEVIPPGEKTKYPGGGNCFS